MVWNNQNSNAKDSSKKVKQSGSKKKIRVLPTQNKGKVSDLRQYGNQKYQLYCNRIHHCMEDYHSSNKEKKMQAVYKYN